MELYQGIILGIVQGLTEFLPVSSSGHLVLGQIFFGMTESRLSFDISVHVGTLMAVVVVYEADIRRITASVLRYFGRRLSFTFANVGPSEGEDVKTAACIVLGSIPTALIGLILKRYESVLFSSALLVGCMLVVTGFILWMTKGFYGKGDKTALTVPIAVLIGITQGLAVIPGISRSGSTIAAGMFLGLDRQKSARFSFLLSIPAIAGAALLDIRDLLGTGGFGIDPTTLCATMASFITGLMALKLLLRLVHAGRFHLFAPYCWLIGCLVLLSNMI